MAWLRLLLAVVAAVLFVFAGSEFRSVDSLVEDPFYPAMELFCYALAALSLALGFGSGLNANRLLTALTGLEGEPAKSPASTAKRDPFVTAGGRKDGDTPED